MVRKLYRDISQETPKTNEVIKLLRVVGASMFTPCPTSFSISKLEFGRFLPKLCERTL